MSDYVSVDDVVNKLSYVVRRPQEGKTFICIKSILKDVDSANINIILTMNTITSSNQFNCRINAQIPDIRKKMIVFNSKKESANGCKHAKTAGDVCKHIKKSNIKVVLCCANSNKIKDGLFDVLDNLNDSKAFTENKGRIIVHIDEAHKYIPEYRDSFRMLNKHPIVSKIIGYSASPKPILTSNPNDSLFYEIYISDPEKEHNMIRSDKYFGVKDCKSTIIDTEERKIIDKHGETLGKYVSDDIIYNSLTKSEKKRNKSLDVKNKIWYDEKFPFNFGNETLLLCVLMEIIPGLVINPNIYSYHFIPGYPRKFTHYKIADIIHNSYKNANVIIINGNGIQLLRLDDSSGKTRIIKTDKDITTETPEQHVDKLLEPAYVIEELIRDYPNCPTFITGYLSVGMSVTLINEKTGNFDNVVMVHEHCNKEELYQLCRFLFNYVNWSYDEYTNPIKPTRFISFKQSVYNICLDYEKYIETLTNDYKEQFYRLDDSKEGIETSANEERYRDIRRRELDRIKRNVSWKSWDVDTKVPKEEECIMDAAENYYKQFSGNEINERSKPKCYKDDPAFKACTTTDELRIHTKDEIKKHTSSDRPWDSLLQLVPGKLKYVSRMFIGYNNIHDPTEYTIWIKSVTLSEDDPEVLGLLKKYGKNNKYT